MLDNHCALISADYRLAPETKLNEILADVRDVVGWLKKHGHDKFKIDTGKIVVSGGSAGGYLALSTGSNKENAPHAIIIISAATDFSNPVYQTGDLSLLKLPGPYDVVKDSIVSHGDYTERMALWRYLGKNRLAVYEIFGFDPVQNPDRLEKFRLTNNIDSAFPPTLIIHVKNDHLTNSEGANALFGFRKK